MRILADENISELESCFAGHSIRRKAGRAITRADLSEIDALLVRSVTPVTPELVRDTPVRFVGTATIGTDHLDLEGLEQLGIVAANAAGCNAEAVAEYVITSILTLNPEAVAQGKQFHLGIVGLGNVGQRLAKWAERLGWQATGVDPFVTREGVIKTDLHTLLPTVDALSLHVPLTTGGPHATRHLIGANELARLRPDALLINSARGSVVSEQALIADVDRTGRRVVLDVFEHEPQVSAELLEHVTLATPHIAGYSLEGKARGTRLIAQAFNDWLRATGQAAACVPALSDLIADSPCCIDATQPVGQQLIDGLAGRYDIRADDRRLREGLRQGAGEGLGVDGRYFDQLRKNYDLRREWLRESD